MSKTCQQGLSDKREYRIIQLGNSIDAILVHDPETDKSSACLGVGVGSCHDYEGANGLAHFLEHMLFLGTEKYPVQNEYMDFISKNSGSCNAFTAGEMTVYYFQVSNKGFEGATDRFAQFFISPLFTEELADKELNAVNSEFELRQMNDLWRKWQLLKSRSVQGHPFSKFNVGNLETLRVPGIREELLKFYAEYYSSNIMKLVLYSNENLDKQEQMAREMFSGIKNKSIPFPDFTESPYQEQNLSRLIKLVPVQDKDYLELIWITKNMVPHYRANPHKYISHLLGHEGENSLLGLLIEEGLALELGVSHYNMINVFDVIWVSIRLTQEGLARWRDGIHEWIFKEVQTTNRISFDFKKKAESMDTTVDILRGMFKYPLEDNLVRNYLFEEYQPEFIKSELQSLTHSNMIVFLSSKSNTQECQETEYWYKTKYLDTPLDDDLIQRSKNPAIVPKSNRKTLGVPPPNIFLPESLEIYNEANTDNTLIPQQIYNENNTEIYFKQDLNFKQPRAEIEVRIHTERLIQQNTNALLLSEIWASIFELHLKDISYLAEVALLRSRIEAKSSYLKIIFSGFNDSMKNYIPAFFQKLVNFNIDDYQFVFQNIVQKYIQQQKSFKKKDPYLKAFDLCRLVIQNTDVYETDESLRFLESLTFDDLRHFSHSWLKKAYLQWLYLGNLKQEHVLNIQTQVQQIISGWQPLDRSLIAERRVVQLPSDYDLVYEHFIQNLEGYEESNSVFSVFYQIGTDNIVNHVLGMLLQNFMKIPVYDQLRTTEQLGYVVFANIFEIFGQYYFYVLVSSNVKSPTYIHTRLQELLEKIKNKVTDLSDEDYNKIVQSVNVELSKKDVSLDFELARYSKQIEQFKYIFDIKNRRIQFLHTVTKEQFKQFFLEQLIDQPHKVELHLISQNRLEENQQFKTERESRDRVKTIHYSDHYKLQRNHPWSRDFTSPI